jgi:preprotein translocase subunit SecG
MSYTLFLVLIIVVAILLILIIMVQNPKGGGLSSSFGGQGSQSLGGVQNTTNFLDKATWTLAIALAALILLSNFAISRDTIDTKSQVEKTINERDVSNEIPAGTDSQTTTLQDSTKK